MSGRDRKSICTCTSGSMKPPEEKRANRNLIEAAPDMLAALRTIHFMMAHELTITDRIKIEDIILPILKKADKA